MYKKASIGDGVALEMDRILNDSSFQSKFEPMVVTASVEESVEDEGYNAFMRFAKKKDKEEEVEEDSKKSKSKKKEDSKGKFPFFEKGKGKGKKDKEEEDEPKKGKGKFPFFEKGKGKGKKEEDEEPKKGKGKKDKKAEAQALEYIIATVSRTSEVLDNLGLDKSATKAVYLLNGIIREASIKQAEEDPEMMESLRLRVDNSDPFEFVSFEDEDEYEDEYEDEEEGRFDGPEIVDSEYGPEGDEDFINTEIDISDDPISDSLDSTDDLIFDKEVVALTKEMYKRIKK
jgi:hypothetical protein